VNKVIEERKGQWVLRDGKDLEETLASLGTTNCQGYEGRRDTLDSLVLPDLLEYREDPELLVTSEARYYIIDTHSISIGMCSTYIKYNT
jgi:hypothetical protein